MRNTFGGSIVEEKEKEPVDTGLKVRKSTHREIRRLAADLDCSLAEAVDQAIRCLQEEMKRKKEEQKE